MLDTIQVVLDRPRDGDPQALRYVAEPVGSPDKGPIAASPVFHPVVDLTAHRDALAQLESHLRAAGWQRDKSGKRGLIGIRFHRLRDPLES